ncbi:MAG: type II toxin-antitoxin system RelE/ParE family toxin [Acidobacteriota bacterium]|nr:type II toxin-antitoxin system RelE/ParE family toxin [Acidobacteriota bacterium]
MLRTFRHRGLKRLFERGDKSKLQAYQVVRIEEILARLDVAVSTNDLNTPGYRLHPLKGNLRGFWSIRVSANMRIIFRIEAGDVFDVDLTDYH